MVHEMIVVGDENDGDGDDQDRKCGMKGERNMLN